MPRKDKDSIYYHKLLQNTNVQAYLQTVIVCENYPGVNPYISINGSFGRHFTDTTKHPFESKGDRAAGAFQQKPATWAAAKKALSLPDFGRQSQWLAGVWILVNQTHATNDILAGNIQSAFNKSNRVWRALPGAPKGQNNGATKTLDEALRIYESNGGVLNNVGANIIHEGDTYGDFNFFRYLDGLNRISSASSKLINDYQKKNGTIPFQLIENLIAKKLNYLKLFEGPHKANELINDPLQQSLLLHPKPPDQQKQTTKKKKSKQQHHAKKIGYENTHSIIESIAQIEQVQHLPIAASRPLYNLPAYPSVPQKGATANWPILASGLTNSPLNVQNPVDYIRGDGTTTHKKHTATVDLPGRFMNTAREANSTHAAKQKNVPHTFLQNPGIHQRHAPDTRKTVTINLNKPLIEHFTIHAKDVKDGMHDFKRKVEEVLLEIIGNC